MQLNSDPSKVSKNSVILILDGELSMEKVSGLLKGLSLLQYVGILNMLGNANSPRLADNRTMLTASEPVTFTI